MSSREDEERRRELFQFIRDVSEVEEIPMSQITELANLHVIDITRYRIVWDKLCREGWKLIELAEERMEAADEY